MQSPTILIVDDNVLIRFAITEFLREFGYNVVMAKDGSEALSQLDSCVPDLVVTDMTMPNLDGRALIAALHIREPNLPVILMSGDPQSLERQSVPTIHKPFEFSELHRLVCRTLETCENVSHEEERSV